MKFVHLVFVLIISSCCTNANERMTCNESLQLITKERDNLFNSNKELQSQLEIVENAIVTELINCKVHERQLEMQLIEINEKLRNCTQRNRQLRMKSTENNTKLKNCTEHERQLEMESAENNKKLKEAITTLRQGLAPVITSFQPADLNVSLLGYVVLRCQAKGYPFPAIIWKLGQKLIVNSVDGDRHLLLPDGSLHLFDFQYGDEGTYTCTAVNGILPHAVQKTRLHITVPPLSYAPELIQENETIFVKIGTKDEVLDCYAAGWPIPSITWWRNNTALKKSSEKHRFRTTLHRYNITEDDLGPYVCKAQNKIGKVNRTVTLVKDEVIASNTTPILPF